MSPATQELLASFTFADLPEDSRGVAQSCALLAEGLAEQLGSDDPQVQAALEDGLTALLEARDCFVQARRQMTRERQGNL